MLSAAALVVVERRLGDELDSGGRRHTHRHTHTAAAFDRLARRPETLEIDANADGYAALLCWAQRLGEPGFAIEGPPATAPAWPARLRSLVARGLAGVRLVSSDAHPRLVDAIAAMLPGAAWQRCRTHCMRNLLTRVPKSAQSFVATMVRTIFAQPDAATVHEQHARIVDQLQLRFPEAATLLEEAGPDLLAFASFPKEHWRQLWSTDENVKGADSGGVHGLGRWMGRGGTGVVGVFPDRPSTVRTVGAVLAEQHDEWAVDRRYMSAESIAKGARRPGRRARGGDRDRDRSRRLDVRRG